MKKPLLEVVRQLLITMFGCAVTAFAVATLLTDNIILATLFGGVLYGLGIGIAFSAESSTGGTYILGRIIQHLFPYL